MEAQLARRSAGQDRCGACLPARGWTFRPRL